MSILPIIPIFDIGSPFNRRKVLPKRKNPFIDFDDIDFYERYRFSKDTFSYICDLIRPDLEFSSGNSRALSPEQQLCVALRFYATGTHLQVVGDATVHASKSTISTVVSRVTASLAKKLDEFVNFPESDDELRLIRQGFYRVGKLPGIVGAVDGTHVKIQAPSGDQEPYYVDRDGNHSINVQGICDANGRLLNVVADWPGSTHDSRILQMSHIGMAFASGRREGILIGDSGYAGSHWLLTPLLNPQGPSENRYNCAQKVTRSVIERTFGRWKRKFSVLHNEIRMDPLKVCRIIGACAVLYNIAVDRKEVEDLPDDDLPAEHTVERPSTISQQGNNFRKKYISKYFS